MDIVNHQPAANASFASYWLFRLPPPDIRLDMDFYRRQGNDLRLINRQCARPDFPPDSPLDTLIKSPLRFTLDVAPGI